MTKDQNGIKKLLEREIGSDVGCVDCPWVMGGHGGVGESHEL